MEKWLQKRQRLSVCFFITFFFTASGDVTYLNTTNGSSIQFSCVFDLHEKQEPFAFTLRREWIRVQDVLYHNFEINADVQDSTFVGRISDRMVNKAVSVNITDLQGFDTDRYVCLFHYQTPAGFHNQSGRDKIVLYVKDVHIKPCSSYTPLLFALSAGAGLLFFIIVIITAVHCMKPSSRGQMKPQHSVPIYEEMNGVREKPSSRLQEDDVSSLYVKPRKENPYIN
ncbi:hypothetical protein Q7C36_005282 [Tachysurus vachellii]|uniref:Immunoglobulin V-set domain-containing protein n=1 Tax=Tachysurus vachellii TaxID=175792 RepID=A0AA88NHA0_TACVA|nr:cd7 antigen-like [Tachysurus vachellii]KAK2857363.1 hypothetical protein Q7C36_005282 [Tachysurus vachellii]